MFEAGVQAGGAGRGGRGPAAAGRACRGRPLAELAGTSAGLRAGAFPYCRPRSRTPSEPRRPTCTSSRLRTAEINVGSVVRSLRGAARAPPPGVGKLLTRLQYQSMLAYAGQERQPGRLQVLAGDRPRQSDRPVHAISNRGGLAGAAAGAPDQPTLFVAPALRSGVAGGPPATPAREVARLQASRGRERAGRVRPLYLQNVTNPRRPTTVGAICSTFMQNAPDLSAGRRFSAESAPDRAGCGARKSDRAPSPFCELRRVLLALRRKISRTSLPRPYLGDFSG